jgi:hypothetical protein
MFVDERKEKLKAIEDRAKRELSMLPPEEFKPEDLRGAFVKGTKYLKKKKNREKQGYKPLSTGVVLIIIILLIIVWHYLESGTFLF